MADFLWSLSAAQLPETLFDWQRIVYGLRVPNTAAQQIAEDAPQLAIWNFRGEQPLAGGLAALLAEYFRWMGPSFELIFTRFEQTGEGELVWSSEMMQIDPTVYTPEFAEHDAKLWGELSADTLALHFAFGDATHDWTLSGDTLHIATQLIGIVPDVLTRLGLQSTGWKADEPIDLNDSDALAALLRAWGEMTIRDEVVGAGFDEYTDALQGAIRRIVEAAMTGSRFACWAACRALWPVAADADSPHQTDAEDSLVSLGSVFPRVAWPSIALSLLEWSRDDYERATDLLETAIESDPTTLQGWQLLAILYEQRNQYERAIEVCREAIAGNIADASIYYNLGNLLMEHGEDSDSSEGTSEATILEAISMFNQAEQRGLREPELYMRLMDAYEAIDDQAAQWDAFERLIHNDPDGAVLWQVIEDSDTYDDFEPGLARLKQAADAAADDYGLHAAYVRALIVLDKHEEATQAIPGLRQIATDDYARAETAQLALEATAPDFEEAYAEVADELESGALPNADVIGLLRDALTREPAFADGAVMLAQAYQLLDDGEAAMQVLSRARELLPDHLELILTTADILWENDDNDLALWTMQEALKEHPNDVALLARLGEYYFEIQEDNLARDYLERAESFDPRHPELVRVREEIARRMADDELADDVEE